MGQGDALLFGPTQQGLTDVFGAVVHADGLWLATPLDDVVQAADDPLGRQGEVDLDAQAVAVEVIEHVQKPERAAVLKPISHEIHRPSDVRLFGHCQSVRHVPLQPFARLDPQVQFQGAVDAVDALVVPRAPLHVAQMQETQPKSPCLASIGQADQRIGDQLVLVTEQRAVAIARLADAKGPARECDADPSML